MKLEGKKDQASQVEMGTQTETEESKGQEESKQPTAIDATVYQSELLKQIMQVGSLFNLKAFGGLEESEEQKQQQAKERKERILKRQI